MSYQVSLKRNPHTGILNCMRRVSPGCTAFSLRNASNCFSGFFTLDAGAIPYICTTSSETIVPVFVISSTASSVISASSQSRRSSIDSDESQKESFYHSSYSSIPLLSIYEKNLTPYESGPFISFHIFVYEIFSARKSVIICSVSSNPLAS